MWLANGDLLVHLLLEGGREFMLFELWCWCKMKDIVDEKINNEQVKNFETQMRQTLKHIFRYIALTMTLLGNEI